MTITIEGKEYLPLWEAAEKLGTTVTHVLMLLRGNLLEGRCVNQEWYVEAGTTGMDVNRKKFRIPLKGCAGCSSTGGCTNHIGEGK